MRYAYFPLNVTQVFLQYSFQPALFCQRPGRILLPASVCWPAFVDLYTYVCPNFFRYVSNVYNFASFEGLFSAVSMPIVATKSLFFNVFRDLLDVNSFVSLNIQNMWSFKWSRFSLEMLAVFANMFIWSVSPFFSARLMKLSRTFTISSKQNFNVCWESRQSSYNDNTI